MRRHDGPRPRALARRRHPDRPARRFLDRLPRGLAGDHPRRWWHPAAPRIIGAGPALDFILRGRIVSPQQALELGLVSELADDASARAVEVAEALAERSPIALAAAKRSVLRGSSLPLAEGLRVEADCFLATMLSDQGAATMAEWGDEPWMRAVAERYLGSGQAGLRRLEAPSCSRRWTQAGSSGRSSTSTSTAPRRTP